MSQTVTPDPRPPSGARPGHGRGHRGGAHGDGPTARPAPGESRDPSRVPGPHSRAGRSVMSGRVVVVGGGLAAGTVVTQLREGGHDGSITVFTEEPRPPYERPPLSKDLLLGKGTEEKALVQQEEWYAENDVDLRLDTAVTSLDVAAREVVAGVDRTPYDHLVLATGSRPRHLRLADESGAPVVYLRTMEDSRRIKAALTRRVPHRDRRRRLDRPRGCFRGPQRGRRGDARGVPRAATAACPRSRGRRHLRRAASRARRRPPARRVADRHRARRGAGRPRGGRQRAGRVRPHRGRHRHRARDRARQRRRAHRRQRHPHRRAAAHQLS